MPTQDTWRDHHMLLGVMVDHVSVFEAICS